MRYDLSEKDNAFIRNGAMIYRRIESFCLSQVLFSRFGNVLMGLKMNKSVRNQY